MVDRHAKDAADFAEADRLIGAGAVLIQEGRVLRQRVNTRIRNRRWRESKGASVPTTDAPTRNGEGGRDDDT